ncbi:hypothetical protein EYF80_053667 [Liparis tanakae]|uniref:Uncharacterized protein n=1 Tax=Liparis tanakae TaxID=230148 RepID=A0A4Z2F5I1_9TELE|nr:hypothetical protein EYF80_053667 [Liparis tanakae]
MAIHLLFADLLTDGLSWIAALEQDGGNEILKKFKAMPKMFCIFLCNATINRKRATRLRAKRCSLNGVESFFFLCFLFLFVSKFQMICSVQYLLRGRSNTCGSQGGRLCSNCSLKR